MDLSKFIALLQDRALHFARADKLGDPFEGSSPKRNKEILQEAIVRDRGNKAEEVLEALSRSNKSFIATMNISCWHMNEYESAAMWSLYSKSSDTIGIQTTYHILASILPEQVYAGVVEYIDYNTDTFNANNIFNPFVRKRKSYEHERELRAIIVSAMPPGNATKLPPGFISSEDGVKVPVDLNLLIQKVFVSPTSPQWFKGVVEGLRDRYGLTSAVEQSSLADAPLH